MTAKYLNTIEEKALRDLKDKLIQVFGSRLRNIILFGSKARGDFNDDSDIDLLIVIDDLDLNDKDIVSDIVVDIQLEYELPIAVHRYSTKYYQEQMNNIVNLFMNNIKSEGIAV